MTTQNKKPVQSKPASKDNIIKQAVDDILNHGIDFNTVIAKRLFDANIDPQIVMNFQPVIKKIGLENGWILTDEQIKEKVLELSKGKKPAHFLDVIALANSFSGSQLSDLEKQKAVVKYTQVESSLVAKPAKFKTLTPSDDSIHGRIAQYIIDNPNFTPAQIIDAGKSMGDSPATKTDNYVNEFLSYQEFFRNHFIKIGVIPK